LAPISLKEDSGLRIQDYGLPSTLNKLDGNP